MEQFSPLDIHIYQDRLNDSIVIEGTVSNLRKNTKYNHVASISHDHYVQMKDKESVLNQIANQVAEKVFKQIQKDYPDKYIQRGSFMSYEVKDERMKKEYPAIFSEVVDDLDRYDGRRFRSTPNELWLDKRIQEVVEGQISVTA